MNVINSVFAQSSHNPKDEAHIWRSRYFDQSARCEARLRKIVELKRPKDQVPHQFKAVALTAKQIGLEDTNDEKLAIAVDELMPLIELRAQLAHSVMRLMTIDGNQLVTFANAGGDQEYGQKVVMLTIDQRSNALKKLSNISERLKRIRNSFSSAPTPAS
jgi:hypothetical protein